MAEKWMDYKRPPADSPDKYREFCKKHGLPEWMGLPIAIVWEYAIFLAMIVPALWIIKELINK